MFNSEKEGDKMYVTEIKNNFLSRMEVCLQGRKQ